MGQKRSKGGVQMKCKNCKEKLKSNADEIRHIQENPEHQLERENKEVQS
jgi:hypothetical protein